ncbi:MAG: hypothetical protein ACI8O8_001551 [Oleiphilaceae bacterium]|jgi:hypothetical protein
MTFAPILGTVGNNETSPWTIVFDKSAFWALLLPSIILANTWIKFSILFPIKNFLNEFILTLISFSLNKFVDFADR